MSKPLTDAEIAAQAARELRDLIICEDCKTRGIPGTSRFNWPLCSACATDVGKADAIILRVIEESRRNEPFGSMKLIHEREHSGSLPFTGRKAVSVKIALIGLILLSAASAQESRSAVPSIPGLTRFWFGGGSKGILVKCALTEKGKPVNCVFVGNHTLDEVMQSYRWYNTGDWKTKTPELGEVKGGKQWDGWDWNELAKSK